MDFIYLSGRKVWFYVLVTDVKWETEVDKKQLFSELERSQDKL